MLFQNMQWLKMISNQSFVTLREVPCEFTNRGGGGIKGFIGLDGIRTVSLDSTSDPLHFHTLAAILTWNQF